MLIGFIGGGRIAQAMAKGFIAAGITKGNKIIASCAPEDQISADSFKSLGATINYDNKVIVKESELTIIAVKPNILPAVLTEINKAVTTKNLLISVAMGVTIEAIESRLPEKSRVLRVMPNTPSFVRQGATVYAPGRFATQEDCLTTERLFKSVGSCNQVGEYLFDAVTAVSGSGPAYVYTVIEAMADGGVRMGLPRDLALTLSAQTVLGAATMVVDTGTHPAILRDNVTSPAGSTAEGVYSLERVGIRRAFIEAIESATERCKQVAKST